MKSKNLLLLLPLIGTLSLFSSGCDKPEAPQNRPGSMEAAASNDITDPGIATDTRQRNAAVDKKIATHDEKIAKLEKSVAAAVNKKDENDQIFQEMTKTIEALDRRCGEVERENATLRNLIRESNSGGFNR